MLALYKILNNKNSLSADNLELIKKSNSINNFNLSKTRYYYSEYSLMRKGYCVVVGINDMKSLIYLLIDTETDKIINNGDILAIFRDLKLQEILE